LHEIAYYPKDPNKLASLESRSSQKAKKILQKGSKSQAFKDQSKMATLPPSGRGRNSRGSGRGGPVKRAPAVLHVAGLTPDLKTNVIDYGVKNAGERLKTAMRETATYSGSKCGMDISTELSSRECFIIPLPVLPHHVIDENNATEQRQIWKNTRKLATLVSKNDLIEATHMPSY
jgi:hypothetical protein